MYAIRSYYAPRGSGQAWRISVIYDDNGMSSGAPVRAHLVGNSGELCIREDEAGAKLRMADNESPKQPGETGQCVITSYSIHYTKLYEAQIPRLVS